MSTPEPAHRPVAVIFAGLALGIFAEGCHVAHPLLIAVPLVAAIVLWTVQRRVWGIAAAAVAVGIIIAWIHSPAPLPPIAADGDAVVCSAHVERSLLRENGTRCLTCCIDSIDSAPVRPFKARVNLLGSHGAVFPGQHILFCGQLEPITRGTDLPDETDYGSLMRSHGIVAIAQLRPDALLRVWGSENIANRWRRTLAAQIIDTGFDGPTTAFLLSVLLGDSTYLPEDTRTALSRAGIAHVLSISGLHTSIILGIIMWMLLPLTFYGAHRLRLVVAIGVLWIYVAVVGWPVSAVRATLMATTVALGSLLERPTDPFNSLCLAGVIILAINPAALWGIDFQLSFSAVAGILIFSRAAGIEQLHSAWLRGALSFVIVSCAAMLSAGVLSMLYFHVLPAGFLIGNLAASVLLPLLIIIGIGAVAWGALAGSPGVLLWLADKLYGLLDTCARAVAAHLPDSLGEIYITPWAVAAVAVILFAVDRWWPSRRRVCVAASLGAVAVSALLAVVLEPEFPQREMFLTRHSSHTTIVRRDGSRLWLVTTAPPADHPELLQYAERHYSDYRRRRGLDTFAIVPHAPVVQCGTQRWALIASARDTAVVPQRVDRLIVTRGFHGDVVALARRWDMDTVTLSRDINRRRAMRYSRELAQAGFTTLLFR